MYRSKIFTPETAKLSKTFPPGHFIREELAARRLSQRTFAKILGRPAQYVSDLLNAKRSVTPRAAVELAAALGVSAHMLLSFQQSWELSKVKPADPAIARRARELSRKRAA